MLQTVKTEKKAQTYSYNPAFVATRKPAERIDRIELAADLIAAGWTNYNAVIPSRYHFHVLNVNHVYVTIILTKENKLTLRGKVYNTLATLFEAVDTYKD